MADELMKDFEYFKEHQDELVELYNGRVLVIHNQSVYGDYDDNTSAYLEAVKEFKPGTFTIQYCISGPDAYTVRVSSLGMISEN